MTPPDLPSQLRSAAIVSFRLGGSDGVSVEAAKWAAALDRLGLSVRTVAGEGHAEVILPGLAMDAASPPTASEMADAVADADVVIVENLCSLPLNPAAARVVARVLKGRPAILRHHDLAWQRSRFADHPPPPHDQAWAHVTVNDLSRRQLAARGIPATTIHNCFETEVTPVDREAARATLAVEPSTVVVLQPTRAIRRKNVPGGLALSEALGALYWLRGAAEEGYGPELAEVLASARVPVRLGAGGLSIEEAYAACDVVALPSTWEGFGNPAIESATHRRPLAVGSYPVAAELAAFGFRWFPADDAEPLARWLSRPDTGLLDDNLAVARRHFSLESLPDRLAGLLSNLSTRPPAERRPAPHDDDDDSYRAGCRP